MQTYQIGLKYKGGQQSQDKLLDETAKARVALKWGPGTKELMTLEYLFSLPGADGFSLSLRQGRCLLEAFN